MNHLHKPNPGQADQKAATQEQIILEIFRSAPYQWFTRNALQRAYLKKTGKELRDTSASRSLSNLSHPGGIGEIYPEVEIIYSLVEKSSGPIFDGESCKVHGWRLRPNQKQEQLF